MFSGTLVAVHACVLPVTFYGVEVWLPGLTKYGKASNGNRGQEVSTNQGNLLDKLDKVLGAAARAVVPAWHTLPTPPLPDEKIEASLYRR